MIRKGYVSYDTRVIPTYYKESMVEYNDNYISNSVLFDADSDFHLEIGVNVFSFEKGLHFFPMLCLFNPVRLIDNFENVKKYTIRTNEDYFVALKSMSYYFVVFTNIHLFQISFGILQ
jgi:hypothetical protein